MEGVDPVGKRINIDNICFRILGVAIGIFVGIGGTRTIARLGERLLSLLTLYYLPFSSPHSSESSSASILPEKLRG